MYLRDALDQALHERGARQRDGRWLGAPVLDDEWSWCAEEGYVEAYRRGDVDIVNRAVEALTERRRRSRGAGGGQRAAAAGVTTRGPWRTHEQALSTLLIRAI